MSDKNGKKFGQSGNSGLPSGSAAPNGTGREPAAGGSHGVPGNGKTAEAGNGGQIGPWIIPVLVALIGAFMSILDSSIVNVAVPTIMSVFNASTSTVEWVVTIYMLAMGVVVPLSGWLGDKLGFKRLYIFSMAVFVFGSLLCAMSWSINSLIVARVIQAMGGGMIMPTTMAMIFRMVPKERIGGGMGVFGIALLVAPAIGPTLGGYLVEYVNWRWIFTINLPIGAIGILLSLFLIPEFQTREAGSLDIGGALTSAAGLFCLLLALSKGADWGWHSESITLLLYASAVCIILFIYLELTSANPLLELRVYRYPTFTMANLMVVITTIGLYAGMFYLPLFLQEVRGLGAMDTGLLMMPGALTSAVMMPIAGNLYDRFGPRLLAVCGIAALAYMTYVFHGLSLETATTTIIYWVMVRGAVIALANMPAQTAAMAVLPTELVGRGSAMTNIIRQVASSFGIAVLTSMMNTRIAVHSAQMATNVTPWNLALNDFFQKAGAYMGGGAISAQVKLLGTAYLEGIVARAAFVKGIDDVFIIAAAVTLFGVIPALFLRNDRGPGVQVTGE